MKNRKLRNIGIIAHIDAGKTTTSERFLFLSGRIHRMGEVHDGDTVMDWREDEQQRGITIAAAATTISWNGYDVNLIDTPGHVDFTAEVERSLRVIDGAVVVICAVNGVEAQSETVWRQADHYHVPRVCFVNKLDRSGASFPHAVDSLRTRLGANAIPIQLPCFDEQEAPTALIDLVTMERLVYPDEQTCERKDLGDDDREAALEAREVMIEQLADVDDEVAEKFLSEDPLTADDIKAGLRRATLAGRCAPVLAGTALRNMGVQQVLDAVVDYLPAPSDLPPITGVRPKTGEPVTRRLAADEPFSALVFKMQAQTGGELYYLRVYSGRLKVGDAPINARTGRRERIHDLLRMHAKSGGREKQAQAGDIIAVPGLKSSATGDTLHSPDSPISYEPIEFPEPVVSIAVEPKSSAGRDKLDDALRKMAREDPTFTIREDEDTGQVILSGMGELHLEIITNRLASDFKVDANIGKPRVAYRERVARVAVVDRESQRTLGGKVVYGRIKLRVEPARQDEAVWEVADDRGLPRGLEAQLLEHLRGELQGTGLWGYSLLETRAVIEDVGMRDIDPAGAGLPYALSEAFDEALRKAGTDVLEPIMKLEIATQQEYLGGIHRTLQAKRAVIEEMKEEGGHSIVRGDVPMSEMFGFSNHLRTISQGRASFSMEPAGYAAVPEDVVRKMFGD